MKLLQSINTEVTNNQQQLDEVNILKRGLGKVVSKLPGQRAKEYGEKVSGQHEKDQQIKQLSLKLSKWAGQQGKSMRELTAADLHVFLTAEGLVAPDELKKAGKTPLSKMMKTARAAMKIAVQGNPKRQTRSTARQQVAARQQSQEQQPQAKPQGQSNQQGSNVQTFKAYVDQMDKLLNQMKQAIPS